MRSLRQ